MLRIELISIVILCTCYISYYAYTRLKYTKFQTTLLVMACILLPTAIIISLTPTVSINDYVKASENGAYKGVHFNSIKSLLLYIVIVIMINIISFKFIMFVVSVFLIKMVSEISAHVCENLTNSKAIQIGIIICDGFFLLLAQYVIFNIFSLKYAIAWYIIFIAYVVYRVCKVTDTNRIIEEIGE